MYILPRRYINCDILILQSQRGGVALSFNFYLQHLSIKAATPPVTWNSYLYIQSKPLTETGFKHYSFCSENTLKSLKQLLDDSNWSECNHLGDWSSSDTLVPTGITTPVLQTVHLTNRKKGFWAPSWRGYEATAAEVVLIQWRISDRLTDCKQQGHAES